MRWPSAEVGALALFAVALAITASFFFTSEGRGDGPLPTISMGLPPADATPTPTPVPQLALAEPAPWDVTFFDERGGDQVKANQGGLDHLELVFQDAPFPDLQDDAWSVRVEGFVDLPAGRYTFTVEHDGDMRVFLDDVSVIVAGDGPEPIQQLVTVDHAGGLAELRIEGRDAGGPFLLRWID